MSTNTKPRAPRTRAAVKASQDAAKVEAAEAATVVVEASLNDRQSRYVTDYRAAEATHGSSKHAANVAAVAFFRTLPETVTVTTAKSSQTKPVSARERAARTLEALCVNVERDAKGKVTKGLDTIGYTVQRLTMLVDAFTNAERTGMVKVEALANPVEGAEVPDAESVESLVSALDQAAVVGGKRAAEALASSIREQVETDGDAIVGATPLAKAVAVAQDDVVSMREAKKDQAKETAVVKTGSQVIADAVQVLWDALESESTNLDAGQKSALLGKIQALHAHAMKHLS